MADLCTGVWGGRLGPLESYIRLQRELIIVRTRAFDSMHFTGWCERRIASEPLVFSSSDQVHTCSYILLNPMNADDWSIVRNGPYRYFVMSVYNRHYAEVKKQVLVVPVILLLVETQDKQCCIYLNIYVCVGMNEWPWKNEYVSGALCLRPPSRTLLSFCLTINRMPHSMIAMFIYHVEKWESIELSCAIDKALKSIDIYRNKCYRAAYYF